MLRVGGHLVIVGIAGEQHDGGSDDRGAGRMRSELVELFSSQRCATSPEAEAMVARLACGELLGPEEEVLPIMVLGFHVGNGDAPTSFNQLYWLTESTLRQ